MQEPIVQLPDLQARPLYTIVRACVLLLGYQAMAVHENNNDWFNLLCELFTSYSAWLCIPIAILAFNLINGFLDWFAGYSPAFAGVSALTPVFGGSIAFVILAAGLKAGLEKLKQKKPFEKSSNAESLRNLTRSEFQLLVADSYRRMGFEVVELDGHGTDGKIDLKLIDEAEVTLVHCKYENDGKIGVKPIRQFHAIQIAESADRAIFVTSGIYTQQARNFVIGKQIQLIDGEQLCHWIQPTAELMQADSTGALPEDEETPNCPGHRKSTLLRL